MSVTNGVRPRAQRVRLSYGGEHIARVPDYVLADRAARQAAAVNQDAISVLLGEPPPGRSALDAQRLRQAALEARPHIAISARPMSKAIVNARSAQAAADVRAIARAREPEPEPVAPPELVEPALEPAPEPMPKPNGAGAYELPIPPSRACCHYQDDAPASCACFHSGSTHWFAGELRRDPRCVIALLARGYDQAEIARRLAVSPRLISRLARADGGMNTIPGLLNDRGQPCG
jgi:hypothetical protein